MSLDLPTAAGDTYSCCLPFSTLFDPSCGSHVLSGANRTLPTPPKPSCSSQKFTRLDPIYIQHHKWGMPADRVYMVAGYRPEGVDGRSHTVRFCLPFPSPSSDPGTSIISWYSSNFSLTLTLSQKVRKMLRKSALKVIVDLTPGFYSCLFMGGMRLVTSIDLSSLNKFVQQTKFKTETVVSVLCPIRGGSFMGFLSLKDAYCFVLEGILFQFKHHCFRLDHPPSVHLHVHISVSMGSFEGH